MIDLELYGFTIKVEVNGNLEYKHPEAYAVGGDRSILYADTGTFNLIDRTYTLKDGTVLPIVSIENFEQAPSKITPFLQSWHYGFEVVKWADDLLFLWTPDTDSEVVNTFIRTLMNLHTDLNTADLVVPESKMIAFVQKFIVEQFGLEGIDEVELALSLEDKAGTYSLLGETIYVFKEVPREIN